VQDRRLDQELQHVPQNKQGKQLALRNAKLTRIKRYCLNVVSQSSALLVAIFQDVPLPKAMAMPKIPAPPKKLLCAVTGLPAKYFDPVMFPSLLLASTSLTLDFLMQETQKPYANIAAFKALRKIAA
jgi:hypothetical protein